MLTRCGCDFATAFGAADEADLQQVWLDDVFECIAFFAKRTNTKALCFALGFSAGVMIYVSLVEIFVKAKDSLIIAHGVKTGNIYTVISVNYFKYIMI